jgi:tetratricopeptide (TPR) repeat protein/4-hydroxybenzoate polyprenyltransferase/SAM-dependent methyltransferase
MGKNDVTEIYNDDYAQSYNQKFILNNWFETDVQFEKEVISKLLNEMGEGSTWLDVACGTGYFLSCFPHIKRAGIDISPGMLKQAKKANSNISIVQGDYRDKHPQWEGKWDLVSSMGWAYSYVKSLSELEILVENLANWTSDKGCCFFPFCDPNKLGSGEIKLPYTSKNLDLNGGSARFEAVIWSWIEKSGEQHLNMFAPQVEYMVNLFAKYFSQVEVIEYPLFKGKKQKAIIACKRKQKYIPQKQLSEAKSEGLLSLFYKIVRLNNWWLYKIPPLLATGYASILLMDFPTVPSILLNLGLLISLASLFAYGHIINDIFDIEVDRKVGKSNAMAQFMSWQRFLFCILFITTGFALPILMKFNTSAIILLAINYFLPTIYSVPPLRLKERGFWGILSDAAGAHLIPTLFVAATFLHFSTVASPNALIFSIIAAAWAFFTGIRGILLHQLWDRDNDLKASISTFVTQFQPESVRLWINRFVFPCEIILFSGLAVVLCQFSPWLLGFFTVYVLITLAKLNVTQTSLEPSPSAGKNIIPHDLYEVWLPLALAILLVTRNPAFIIFFGLTLLLFYPSIKIRTMEVFNIVFNEKMQEKKQLEVKLENLQQQLALKTQKLEAQQRETVQAKTEIEHYHKNLQQLQEQAQKQIEELQTQTKERTIQLQLTQSELQTTQNELVQSQTQLQTTQTELAQIKSYLQQTQGKEGLMSYYRSRITSNPDDIQLYHQALTIKSDDEQMLLKLGNALVRQNRFADAQATYQTALQFRPNNVEIHLALGKALEKDKKWDEAFATYQRAISLNPNYSWSHKHLGDILAERGQLNEASLFYHRALQLQPKIC